MNIIHFIRLLLRYKIILIISPLLLAATVFYFTDDLPKTYISKTTVYTGIGTGSSIVSLEEAKFDMFGSRAAFDNLIHIIKSQSTAEEVSLRLLADHLCQDDASAEVISTESYNNLMEITPSEVKNLVVTGDSQATYEKLVNFKNSSYTNFVYELLHFTHPHYSIARITGKLKVTRIQSSDLIEISYSSDDPGICYQTLKLINEIFVRAYSDIKINQSDAVVRYFQGQLENSKINLDEAEKELLEFNKSNTIINYYEQTKHISSEKEHFDLEYLGLKMKYAASESVLKVLEQKLNNRQKTQLNGIDITQKRNELADVNLQIAMKTYQAQIDSAAEEKQIEEISTLQLKAYDIQEELKHLVTQQYFIDNSTEGVSGQTVIQQWLEKVIEFESSRAELTVAEQRSLEFVELFKKYAPLGATMKRLERKIDVAEREYLSLLHSLGLAKLKQQNIELNSNIKVSEPPFFPIKAEPGKRKYMLIIAMMIGLIIPLFIIIALDFLDRNIKSVRRAEQFSGLSVAGVFPNFEKRNHKGDVNSLISGATDRIVQKILFEQDKKVNPEPECKIVLVSHLQGEGKTTIGLSVTEKLSALGFSCKYLSCHKIESNGKTAFVKLDINDYFPATGGTDVYDGSYDYSQQNLPSFTFIEIPALLNIILPARLIRNSHQVYLVTRANRPWNNSDRLTLSELQGVASTNTIQMLLNGVDPDEMETVIGELPNKRSWVRSKVKNFFKMQFFSKSNFDSEKNSKKRNRRIFISGIILIPFSALVLFFTTGIFQVQGEKRIQTETPGAMVSDDRTAVNAQRTEGLYTKNDSVVSIPAVNVVQENPVTLKYCLIGGSFRNRINADQYFDNLEKWGYQPHFIDRENGLYTVAIGIFITKQDAENARLKYCRTDPDTDAWIFEGNFSENITRQ